MQAVILGGGKATRLGALSAGNAKPLVEIGGKPFIRYLLETLRRFGFDDVVILAGPFASSYAASLGDGSDLGIMLSIVPEPAPAGTAGALSYARSLLRPDFLLFNGDSYFDINLLDLVMRARRIGTAITLALVEVPDTSRYGAVTLTGDRIASFGEKAHGGPGLINAGVYWAKREILEQFGGPPLSLESELLPKLVTQDNVAGVAYRGRFIDIGIPEDLERARQLLPQWQQRPAAFLDRDGVLNRDDGYIYHPEDFVWLPGTPEAVKRLNDAGYLVVVITNQAGVARGLYGTGAVEALHRWINVELAREGAHIDGFYFCPHHPTDGKGEYRVACDCRKPAPGMLLQAMRDRPVDRAASFMIGDKDRDMTAARAAGIRGVRYAGGDLDALVSRILSGTA